MKYNITSFPVQKLPASKKTEEWYQSCVDYIIGAGEASRNGIDRATKEEMQSCYDLYNSIYNEKDLKYVTDPFKQDDGFPATAKEFNIIRPKIDLLIGEETKRPSRYSVVRTSNIASSDVQERAKSLLLEYTQAAIMAQMGPEEQARFEEALATGEIMAPEQIYKYLTRSHKDIAEIQAQSTIEYLSKKLNLNNEFIKTWNDALKAGEEIGYVGIINGEPVFEAVNPLYFSYETSEGLEFIHDANSCSRKFRMSVADIYDRFYDKLTEKQLDELLLLSNPSNNASNGKDKNMVDDFNHINIRFNNNPIANGDLIDVYHACWKSFKKIGFVTILNEEGQPEEIVVDESYKVMGDELNVEWDWIIEVLEGYRAGDDFYFGLGPVEYQYRSADNLNSQRLPYTGVIYSNNNSKPKSLVAIMKPLQYMYIIVWYRLELAMARDKGKVLTMDITQIPKSMNIDVAKWAHYMSALGVNFINPYEDGWDIPGREGGKASAFNQINAVDLTMASIIDQYINLLNKIEMMIDSLSGVSAQREGAISSNELVGNVERSVVQSSHITEPLFWKHNMFKREVLTMLLNAAKVAWRDGNKTHLYYMLDDATRAFLQLTDDFFYEDFDIFISDSTKDEQILEQIRSLLQPAMQNGASLLEVAEIMTMNNINMIKNKLEEIDIRKSEEQQAMIQQEQQQEQQIVQMQNEVKEAEMMLDEAKLDLEKYKIDQDNMTKITIAQLNAYRGAENMDQDANGIPDPIELGKNAIAQLKVDADTMNKQTELSLKAREAKTKEMLETKKIEAAERAEKLKATLEKEKIELEKAKLKAAEKIQAMADKAAMERERLKAKTVLKNRVTGEKKSVKK